MYYSHEIFGCDTLTWVLFLENRGTWLRKNEKKRTDFLYLPARSAATATLLRDHHVIHPDEHDGGLRCTLDGLALGPEWFDDSLGKHIDYFAFIHIQTGIPAAH